MVTSDIETRVEALLQCLKLSMPIKGDEIPGFKDWINWYGMGFFPDADLLDSHFHWGYDFAAYLTASEEGLVAFLGLPFRMNVYSIADGIISQVNKGQKHGGYGTDADNRYFAGVKLEHNWENGMITSIYGHMEPIVNLGDAVKRDQLIGTIYKAPEETVGPLPHLHFEMLLGNDNSKPIRVEAVFPVGTYRAKPMGLYPFRVEGINNLRVQIVANVRL